MTFDASIGPLEESGNRDRWNDLRRSCILQTPFSTCEYVEDLAATTGCAVDAVFVENGVVEAGALVLRSKKGGLDIVSPSGFTPFSAIAARSLPTGAQIHARESWMDAIVAKLGLRFAKVDLMLPPDIQDIRPFQWAKWSVTPLYTFRLQLRDPEQTIGNWSEGARRVFKRMNDAYELRSSAENVHDVVNLCLAGYERANRRPPFSLDRLESLAQRQVDRELATCYTVHADGEVNAEAGVVILGRPPDAYYWIAGSIPGPGMTVLIGKLIAELSSHGYESFDLVGANTPSIAEFKRRLTPILVPYYRVTGVRNRLLRIFLSLKESARR